MNNRVLHAVTGRLSFGCPRRIRSSNWFARSMPHLNF